MSEKTTVQLLLEARFKQLAQEQRENNEMPAELRQEVFRTLDLIDVTGEATDHLTGALGEATAEFLDIIEQPKAEKLPPSDPAED